jgi:protein-tyrosine phosphatase
MHSVLFVCLGNTCRSPMAEALFRHKVRVAGREDEFSIDSAGTGDWHVGEGVHQGVVRELTKRGIDVTGLIARQLAPDDLKEFTWVITMDDANIKSVKRLGVPSGTFAPMLTFAPHLKRSEVPDPWYTGNFAEVFDLLDVACDGLLAKIPLSVVESPEDVAVEPVLSLTPDPKV